MRVNSRIEKRNSREDAANHRIAETGGTDQCNAEAAPIPSDLDDVMRSSE